MLPKLGIVAGGGSLPARLVEGCRTTGRPCFVLALEGQADAESFAGIPHEWVRLGGGRAGAAAVARRGSRRTLAFAGRVHRPSLAGDPARPFDGAFSRRSRAQSPRRRFVAERGSYPGSNGKGSASFSPQSLLHDLVAPSGPIGRGGPRRSGAQRGHSAGARGGCGSRFRRHRTGGRRPAGLRPRRSRRRREPTP